MTVAQPVSTVPSNKQQFGAIGGPGRPSPDNSKRRCTIRTDRCEEVRFTPGTTRGDARRYRLARGLRRWNQQQELDPRHVRRYAFMTFTSASSDPDHVRGAMMRFWNAVEHRWGVQRRFVWLELTREKRVHYHCFWLNPPHVRRGLTTQWLASTWGCGYVMSSWRSTNGWGPDQTEYVTGYAKKHGGKAYQQDYDWVPLGLRTFMTERLAYSMSELDAHRTRYAWVYVAEFADRVEKRDAYLIAASLLSHEPECASSRSQVAPVRTWCSILPRAPGVRGRRARVGGRS